MPAVKNVGHPGAGEPHARFLWGREATSASLPRRTAHGASRLPDRPPWMSGSSWKFCGDPVGSWLDGHGLSALPAVLVVRRGDEGVAPDGDDELSEVAVADGLSELLLGDEHAAGRPALAHVAVA